jgi:hypothetical protein
MLSDRSTGSNGSGGIASFRFTTKGDTTNHDLDHETLAAAVKHGASLSQHNANESIFSELHHIMETENLDHQPDHISPPTITSPQPNAADNAAQVFTHRSHKRPLSMYRCTNYSRLH